MRVARATVALLLPLLAGCSVDPTPREYIDRPRAEPVQAETQEIIHNRLAQVVQSLSRGDPAGARRLLAPAPDIRVYGPAPGDRFVGTQQIDALVELVAGEAAGGLHLASLEVDADPRGTVAWFALTLQREPPDTSVVPIRVTGVYRLREGEWELVQAHLSASADGATGGYPGEARAPAASGSPPAGDPTRPAGS